MSKSKLELSRSKVADILVLKDLYYNGVPVESLDKPELLNCLQEITATAMEYKARADRNSASAEDWKKAMYQWRAFAREVVEAEKRRLW